MKKSMRRLMTVAVALVMVMAMSVSAFAAGISSNDAALKKALANAGAKKSQVKYIEIDYDSEDGMYDVEFTKRSNGRHYEYEISAATGKIVDKNVEVKYKRNSSHKKIGKTAARKKVAKFSGISYKTISKGSCRYEYDDGKGIYEVKFTKNGKRYEYDVLAPTGKIIEYGWELISY